MTTRTGPEARVVTERGLSDLVASLGDADTPDDFLARSRVIVSDPGRTLPLPTPPGVAEAIRPGSRGGIDVANAPAVHEYLGEMSRANAADPRLWTYLAFATYRSYMLERWPLDPSLNWRGRIADRWLMTSSTRGRIARHGIARLWWLAHLTFDPADTDDPYAATRTVLSREDAVIGLLDREIGAIPVVAREVVDHLAADPSHLTGSHIRRLLLGLTLAHGYRDLGMLDAAGVRELIDEEVALMAST